MQTCLRGICKQASPNLSETLSIAQLLNGLSFIDRFTELLSKRAPCAK
jgi:hypothetical protein